MKRLFCIWVSVLGLSCVLKAGQPDSLNVFLTPESTPGSLFFNKSAFSFHSDLKPGFEMKSDILIKDVEQPFGLCHQISFSKDSTSPLFKKWHIHTFAGLFYGGSLAALSFLWYSDYSTGRFHAFNDMDEWKGVDKLGHATTAFHFARVQSDLFMAAGYSRGKAARISTACSFAYMSVIEILDGFSSGWGFSVGDMVANTLGSSIFIAGELSGKDHLFSVKMSFHYTDYAQYNPSLLGENKLQQPLKDYNGQTYWLSVNIWNCLPNESRFPAWMNLAVGYGADGMTGGSENPTEVNGIAVPYFSRYSQWYLAPDIDFSKIPVRGRGWKLLLRSLNFIKFPAPALEFNNINGFKFHFLYF